jgi:hypothetical protein
VSCRCFSGEFLLLFFELPLLFFELPLLFYK